MEDDIQKQGSSEPSQPEAGKQQDKMVPEKDLLAVKAGKEKAETTIKDLQAEIQKLKEQPGAADLSSKLKAAEDAYKALEDKHKATEGELQQIRDAELKTLKDTIVKAGISEDVVKDLDKKGLEAVILGIGSRGKPKPDMGTGAGSGEITGSPMELARRAYQK
jgi:seryl-tRNA synthetase